MIELERYTFDPRESATQSVQISNDREVASNTVWGNVWGEFSFEPKKQIGHSEEWPKCLNLLVGAAGFELATPCTP